jgi:serine protease Do
MERDMKHAMRLAGMALIGLVGYGRVLAQPDESKYPDFRQVVQDAKGKVFPAVIYIRCIRESNEAGKKESQQVSGSGVIMSPEGQAMTNWHVIDKATSVRVLLSDGRHADANVLGSDKDTDLALLKLDFPDSEPLPYATLGDSTQLREGDFVMAMGAPWGLNRSVSIGIISCTRRFLETASEYSLWLQTDAAINPGNSGGPMVNTKGEVVGINARGMSGSAEGMGFAIPSETVKIIMTQLREHGGVTWSWSGLQLQPLRDFNKDTYFEDKEGVIVAETDPDSPARAAGIHARDRIVKVNGQGITGMTEEDLPGLRRRLGLLPKGEEATFDVIRDGQPVSIKLTPREKGKVEGEELALERWDFTIKAINQFDNPDLFFYRQKGVFVFGVKYPGNAQNAGLAHHDILLKIDGKEVTTPEDVKVIHKNLIAGVASKSRTVLTVLRGGLMRQIVLDFSRDYSKE